MSEIKRRSGTTGVLGAAIVILAAAVGYLIFETSALRNQLARAESHGTSDSINVDTTGGTAGWPDDAWWRRPFDTTDWDPFEQMERMQNHMRRMFDEAWDPAGGSAFFDGLGTGFGSAPGVELQEEDDRFTVLVDMEGIDESALSIEVKDDVLTIEGQREEITEERDAQGNVTSRSQSTSRFSRSMSLPEPVDADKMKTSLEDGTLRIELPKTSRDT